MAPGRAKLVLLSGVGEVYPGMSFHLNASVHPAGREEGVILFEEDDTLSTHHADFVYREGQLVLEDKGSVNGSYIRLRGPHRLRNQERVMVGRQVLQFEYMALSDRYPAEDGTLMVVSPLRSYRFRLLQILEGGQIGRIHASPINELVLGREEGDMLFPDDLNVSARHARITRDDKGLVLEDLDSSNGTYVRVREPVTLQHGDHLFLGQQLLRVEFNP